MLGNAQHPQRQGCAGKSLKADPSLWEGVAYAASRGVPYSEFLGWDDDDQDLALEWARIEARRCDGCGTLPEDWAADREAYVPIGQRCLGCRAIAEEHESLREQGVKSEGLRIVLVPPEMAPDPDPDEPDEPPQLGEDLA